MDQWVRLGVLACSLLAPEMAGAQPGQEFFKAK